LKPILLVLPFCALPLAAQTLSLLNTSNAALDDPDFGADFVVNDTFKVQITGAAANSPVTLTEYENGVLIAQGWNAGQTDINGDFALPGTETGSYIGTYMEMWYVNGTQVGNTLEFEVISRPGSLSVASAAVASPNCSYPQNVGLDADIKYNILGIDNGGVNIQTSVLMEPWEEGEAMATMGLILVATIMRSGRNPDGPLAVSTRRTTERSTTYHLAAASVFPLETEPERPRTFRYTLETTTTMSVLTRGGTFLAVARDTGL
jgi:hypothetical protein